MGLAFVLEGFVVVVAAQVDALPIKNTAMEKVSTNCVEEFWGRCFRCRWVDPAFVTSTVHEDAQDSVVGKGDSAESDDTNKKS